MIGLRDDGRMEWDDATRERLETALNESDVVGVRLDPAGVEDFLESRAWGGSIYGWRYFDDPALTRDWPADPSLSIAIHSDGGAHSFYWFNECGVEGDGETESFCIEGTVTFDDLVVLDAAEHEIPLETVIADGVRQWDAFYRHDERLSLEAQHESQAGAPRWSKPPH